ncbi:MAG: hypothetical protein IJT01_08875 [Selenomonadaceae bacterium]|nr:hypothetical protein [Selenomonadaceae bacterium]
MPKLYDKVLLKTGETAYIVEIHEPGVAYEADIDRHDGETETDTIYQKDIDKIIAA